MWWGRGRACALHAGRLRITDFIYRQFSTVATSLAVHTRAFLKSSRDLAPHLSSHIGPIGHIVECTPYLVAFANDHKSEFVSPNTTVSLSFSMSKLSRGGSRIDGRGVLLHNIQFTAREIFVPRPL